MQNRESEKRFICLFVFILVVEIVDFFFAFFCFWLWFGLVLKSKRLFVHALVSSVLPVHVYNPCVVLLSLQNSPIQPLHLFVNLLSRVVSAATLLNLLLFFIIFFFSPSFVTAETAQGPFRIRCGAASFARLAGSRQLGRHSSVRHFGSAARRRRRV